MQPIVVKRHDIWVLQNKGDQLVLHTRELAHTKHTAHYGLIATELFLRQRCT